ncbi:tryptophan halogenase family protein [Sphingomonas sp. BAUL-RG-20F-R05-02]|uniref:tryptophan halogenase family protein n=1 Tax=Sphingomonas sp. BAUL-RG-20F-R05-02 TaxID=2914830 RepID=UPI001F5AAB24|nr:tryptophan halogenase family protein [Sphingomonas sp. BAUL-RG-20F-R05-02]
MAFAPVRVIVVGGGTAGWMTAAALAGLTGSACSVDLIESEEIGIIGVGEATLPHLRAFLERLGIDERAFMHATDATYKLGIEFRDFGRVGDRYIHPFGTFGQPLNDVAFHHYYARLAHAGGVPPIGAFSAGVTAAEACRFEQPGNDPNDPTTSFGYAYQFDATRFAPFLRAWSEARGVTRTPGRIVSVERGLGERIGAVRLADGTRIEGDLFVDCSGFRSLLLGGELEEAWEDWSHWLPCDRAVAMPCESPPGPIEPFTRAVAMPAGWRWRIPLRHRIGNGYVYSSSHLDDGDATEALLAALEGAPLAEPRFLRFRAGRRRRSWVGNVVAVGLASGFLEPLESTSIYLVQAAITALIEHFPNRRIAAVDRDGFNATIDAEYDRIRDFLILHYHATTRDDTAFWRHVRTMAVPPSLDDKISLWRQTAQVAKYTQGLFLEPSWVAVLLGQGVLPHGWDQRADLPNAGGLTRAFGGLSQAIAARVAAMPLHDADLLRA